MGKRILEALVFMLGVAGVVFVIAMLTKISSIYLGTPWPALFLFFVGFIAVMAYYMAREDVKLEEIRNGRVHDRLSKE